MTQLDSRLVEVAAQRKRMFEKRIDAQFDVRSVVTAAEGKVLSVLNDDDPDDNQEWEIDRIGGLVVQPGDKVITARIRGRETAILNLSREAETVDQQALTNDIVALSLSATIDAIEEPERIRDTVWSALRAGANITLSQEDAGNTITIAAAAATTDPEVVRDTVGTFIVAGTGISVIHDDANNTLTISNTGGGTPSAHTHPAFEITTGGPMSTTEDVLALVAANDNPVGVFGVVSLGRLAGVVITNPATGHAFFFDGTKWLNRAITQGDVANLNDDLIAINLSLAGKQDASTVDERIRDMLVSALVAGSNVTITHDDANNTITISAASSGSTGGAPPGATYIVQTANADLTAEQALSSLATGLLKVTNGTGVLSTAAASDLPAHTHTKAEAGLGNVDNTSDANKPVSTAQQTALDLKSDKDWSINRRIASDSTTTSTTSATVAATPSLAANSSWTFDYYLRVGCSGSGGMKFSINTPAGAVVRGVIEGMTTATAQATIIHDGNALTTTNFCTVASENGWVHIHVSVLMGATAGNVTLNFASATSGQTSTVKAGSYYNAERTQ